VFNWLTPRLHHARCLDLFAGSGALGVEALSRGAQHATFVEQEKSTCQALENTLTRLQCTNFKIQTTCALSMLKRPVRQTFDIIFMDPPFHQGLIKQCHDALNKWNGLQPFSWIYLEAERSLDVVQICQRWSVIKQGQTKQTHFFIFQPEIGQ